MPLTEAEKAIAKTGQLFLYNGHVVWALPSGEM